MKVVYSLGIYTQFIVTSFRRTGMVGFRPCTARRRLPGRLSGPAMAIGLLLVAACGPAHTASDASPTAGATAGASSTASPAGGSTADCDSVTTCYTPQQL